ncbi:glycosylhydrolase-like jelly roll fold domain-containing protein [Candidatus Merdisoma sp. JLR.KK006]|uniref:glycosylhydrolase-like jelly roll fold domain-containing protein n=1 Tax=Candidatus Merdisoma sp. JLR.KK006 TaxID=3112626 RepID=UPI002FF28FDD
MERLKEVLKGQEENSIMPFFWQHGETPEILLEYVDKIHECGCGGFCVEARPHPDFGNEKWWEDVRLIAEKARKESMEVWILDDAHFPTGYANGLVAKKYPQYLKTYLDCRRLDVVGPLKYARLNLRFLKGRPWEQKGREKDRIIGIYGAKRAEEGAEGRDPVVPDTLVDVTDQAKDGILYWDIPEGSWSVFVVFETRAGGEEATKDYLNPLIREATEVLIEAVYEPHYEHLKEFFGTTITAFFSDEPRFGNAKGTDKWVGKAEMVLPWCEGLDGKLPFGKEFLPFLFADSSDSTMNQVRFAYMDCVSRLYSENFTQVLGEWCRNHGVKYVGHHIEDNGAHARLGYGAGHLFRAQKGQDFSGIDVISNQIAPGYGFHHDAFATGGNDGVFYHYALAHLGASIAHNDPGKNGIAMCEAFGAYGWNEGLKWMKWITDHLLARGINYFVPHAFNPKEYPDWDCAPHFYAHGNNPQFRYFSILMKYMQRMCHLLQGGIHDARVAVLYPAEGEWTGDAKPVEQVLRELDRNQVETTIVSLDDLERPYMEEKAFRVNRNRYECLVVPYMKKIPERMAEKLLMLCEYHVPVIFTEGYPEEIVPCETNPVWTEGMCRRETSLDTLRGAKSHGFPGSRTVPLSELADTCGRWKTLETSEYQEDLISYHYVQPDGEIFLLFNENPAKSLKTTLSLSCHKALAAYDAFSNRLKALSVCQEEGKTQVSLCLNPYESMVILAKDTWNGYPVEEAWRGTIQKSAELQGPWKLSFGDAGSYVRVPDTSGFQSLGEREKLIPLSCEPEFMDKTGTLRYEKSFSWQREPRSRVFINLGEVYEIAEVFLNGESMGVCICPPYRIEITDQLAEGRNDLIIEVTNTLGNENKEFMSHYTPIEPFGLLGPVVVEEESDFTLSCCPAAT